MTIINAAAAVSAPFVPMNPREFFLRCQRHDFLYDHIDDGRTYERHHNEFLILMRNTRDNVPLSLIYSAWAAVTYAHAVRPTLEQFGLEGDGE